ncbi:MAG: SUF system Fe-S cluster assembly regulator [Acidobacteria bacterium]|nr:SUF system Fe-S cluster assembly regulator [Acidobacteriota bacterium]
MFRMNKLTDYGFVILTQMVIRGRTDWNARELAEAVKLPLPTVVKILKMLVKAGILTSQRGTKGGYTLARPSAEIRVASVIAALEGPIALTDCNVPGSCEHETGCPTRSNWQMVNRTVQEALDRLTLLDISRPMLPARFALTTFPRSDDSPVLEGSVAR